MKKIGLTVFLGALVLGSNAQPIPPQSIKDSVLGWIKVYNFKGRKEGLKYDHRSFSGAQLSICDTFANWMQASYLPKGGWGDAIKSVSERLTPYNQYTAGLPPSYGAYSKTYTELKRTNGKLQLYTNSHVWWGVMANGVPGWPVMHICVNGAYYFTQPNGDTEEEYEAVKDKLDISKEKNVKAYISFWQRNLGFGGGKQTVLLCKDNKSPFVKITRGEYMQALEAGITAYYAREKKRIFEAEQGIEKRVAIAMKSLDEQIERYKAGLKLNREKYKNRLQETAMLSAAQPLITNLDNDRDIFTGKYLTDTEKGYEKYPVYKIDSAMAALCKSDKPQWILIAWDHDHIYRDDEEQQHKAILNNFNFEYVYNFFFDPEKVKGKPYQPLKKP